MQLCSLKFGFIALVIDCVSVLEFSRSGNIGYSRGGGNNFTRGGYSDSRSGYRQNNRDFGGDSWNDNSGSGYGQDSTDFGNDFSAPVTYNTTNTDDGGELWDEGEDHVSNVQHTPNQGFGSTAEDGNDGDEPDTKFSVAYADAFHKGLYILF